MNPVPFCIGTFLGMLGLYVIGAIIYVRRERGKPPEIELSKLFAADLERIAEMERKHQNPNDEEREVEMRVLSVGDLVHAMHGNGKAAAIIRREGR